MDITLLVSADATLAAARSRSRPSTSAFHRQIVPGRRRRASASSCRPVRARSAAAAAPAAGGISGVRTAIDIFSPFISVSHDSFFFIIIFFSAVGLTFTPRPLNSFVNKNGCYFFGIRPCLDYNPSTWPFKTESKFPFCCCCLFWNQNSYYVRCYKAEYN